ncbi:unnamed protein product [Penicillium salamii]|uniref:PDZ GRASP-type domain-containing protein n=1 Tax=Penicillium salamii TaxID=1612424 RepID=A0A9W4JLW4_9EURO|nr:unnamed protein product [Penicillium salamii]CAG8037366.1 unnamed protein product [Penicillium salamii]CAG8054174.1 unnamed protein product [Penicillium salamii]CAG8115496.1 unnamed protein product [Penicillium salamii]CAG8260114.1 unnamed protein product [Penicillium salamii]
MFGALNRFIGRLDGEPGPQPRSGPGDNAFGFQVLRNTDPELPLEPWFDFIVGINGHTIEDPDPNLFATECRNCAGGSLTLEGQRTHTVTHPVPPTNPSLGLALQLAPLASTQNIWHVIAVPSPLSPAYRAGLLPYSDYIIGTPSGTLRGEAALGELVEDHLNRTLVLWVYNNEFDVVREVELIPTRGWGGEGALGAELGFGALHRLPLGLGEEVEGPGEVVFETGKSNSPAPADDAAGSVPGLTAPSNNYLVPANMTAPPPLAATQARDASPSQSRSPAGRRAGKSRPGASPNRAFDDYFAEGEEKSRAQDYAPSRHGTPLPPPPKAGLSQDRSESPAPVPVTSVGSPGPAQEE